MTDAPATLQSVASEELVAIVQLTAGRLELVRHPTDGRVVAFDDADAAFCFAVSLEVAGAESAGTIAAPEGMPVHMVERGASAADILSPLEAAA